MRDLLRKLSSPLTIVLQLDVFCYNRTVAATLLKEAQLNYFEDTKIRRTVDSSVATKVVKW